MAPTAVGSPGFPTPGKTVEAGEMEIEFQATPSRGGRN